MNKNLKGTIFIIFATLFWGMSFVFMKEGGSLLDGFTFLFWRFFLATGILIFIFFKKIPLINKRLIKIGFILSIPLAITYGTQIVGLQYTLASKSAFIVSLSVILVPIFLSIINKKLPSLNKTIAVIIATCGLAILTISGKFNFNQGDILSLLCAISFAVYIILLGKYTKKEDSALLTITQLASITIITGLISIFSGKISIPTGYTLWQAILFTSIFATALGYLIQTHYQKYISEIKTAIIFAFEPVFGAITAIFYLGESLTMRIILGGVLIFIALIISEVKIGKRVKS